VPVTFHDSCNNARSCGLYEEPRELIRLICTDFREMYPNRAENYCCTGGGGAMSMSEYTPRRLKSGKVKADQLRATGAKIVITSCHNCVDGLTDLIRHYKLDMEVTQLVNLVAQALVLEEKIEIAEKPRAEHTLKGFKVLVIDDDADTRDYLTTLLQDNEAATLTAPDGIRGIEAARRERPDLITLDLSMPHMDGGEVFARLREDRETREIPVCIVTGKPELRKLIYDKPHRPPEGYLDKPVDEETFVKNVRKILELSHKEKAAH
jgi:CheY-like chemotaxis protein